MFLRIVMVSVLALVLRTGQTAEIFPIDTEWKFLKGFSEASSPNRAAWRQIAFDDSNWTTAPAPFFYGENLQGTLLNDMRGNYTSIFLRKTFEVEHARDYLELRLRALSDDGFIAWINGVEVARYNMPQGDIPYNGTSLAALPEPIPFETFAAPNPGDILVQGVNVLAVHAFNASLSGSSDFVFMASLSGDIDDVPPLVAEVIPPRGAKVRSLPHLEVHFSEPVSGVEASDLLVNGQPAQLLTEFGPDQYLFEFFEPPPGEVEISWRATHEIRDLSARGNRFAGEIWSYLLDPDAPPLGVIISEFMASNSSTLNDEDGDRSDWIELFNAGEETVNLNGWFLTDKADNLAFWEFPEVILPPREYLVLFASGKDRKDPNGPLHTNFRLAAEGEYLALVDAKTNIISEFAPAYPPQFSDVSYGRARGNPDVAGYFVEPTPGGPNSISGPGFSSEVEFSRSSGTFTGSFSLELSAPSPGAEIRYTLDGSFPTPQSVLYTEPVSISATRQVRARAFEPGLLPGPARSETFLQLQANVLNFSSDIPVMVIHNFGGGSVPGSERQFAHISVFDPGEGRASLTDAPVTSTRAGIRIRGSSTRNLPKRSFSVEFWDEYDDDNYLPLLGMPADSDWVLYAPNNFEPVLIHNPFMFTLSNDIGRYAPRTRFVEVYLNTSGGPVTSANYNGVYVLMERVKRGTHRVDVERLAPEHRNPPEVTGGYMLKIDRLGPGESGFSAAGQRVVYVYPKEPIIRVPERAPQAEYIRTYINEFGSVLNGGNYRDPANGYARYIDVDSWIDHHLLNILAFNVDALRLSAHFHKPREGKLIFGPIWDFDRSLGSTDGRDSDPRIWRSTRGDRGTDFFNYPWWGRLFTDPNFWQRYIDRWQELREQEFSTERLHARVDALTGEVREAQPREVQRWPSLTSPRGGSYQFEINHMKNWLRDRVEWIDGQFLDRPVLSHPGGLVDSEITVTLSGPPGSIIYYTLDGTDPRSSGGGTVSPSALIYSQPLLIARNSRITARAFDSNHRNLTGPNNPPISSSWSGLAAGIFLLSQPELIVTEIMFQPPGGPEGTPFEPSDFEFIELMNRGSDTLILHGFQFTRGIRFDFSASIITQLAPGERLILVRNIQAFTSRYGAGFPIAGEYEGRLDNSGEWLAIEGPFGETALEFRYDDRWEPLTKGFGFSLVLADETIPLSGFGEQENWRLSSAVGGSPGKADSVPPAFPRVVINEALAHTDPPQVDAIELYNSSFSHADLSGWFLTDDFRDPKKYRIPDGTRLPPGGFMVFTEEHFNQGENSFALSSLGEEVYLFSGGRDGNLTGYFHGFAFEASENGVSFGRHLSSAGEEHFVAQNRLTLGAPNAGPLVGPVVLNEIMFYPPRFNGENNTIDEYLELHNVTDQPVQLFDPEAPENTWQLMAGVRFEFPSGWVIPPRGFLLVTGFDPQNEPEQLARFRQLFQVNADVPILGPFRGNLNNAGERVALYKPDGVQGEHHENAGYVPYVLVDEVEYGNSAPWPDGANGTGHSLQRFLSSSYGNDPMNWDAAPPAAGGPNLGSTGMDTDGDGLPDAWELLHGLDPRDPTGDDGAAGDPDGDGRNNLEEFLSGTDPRDPLSHLRIDSVGFAPGPDRSVQIRFRAMASIGYQLLHRDRLEDSWRVLADIPPEGETRELEILDSPANSERFYQLRIQTDP